MQEDEEIYEMPSIGEKLEIILLEPWAGKNIGDIATVTRGVYNTMIYLKQGIPLNCWGDMSDKQKLVNNAKNLEKENEELAVTNSKLYDENFELKKKIESLKSSTKKKSHQNYDNKMMVTKCDK